MILGIDLGTSNSMAAVYKDGEVILVESRTGSYVIPSVVSMDENGIFYTGDVAKQRKKKYPDTTVDMFKRSMGTDVLFCFGEKKIKAEELSAILLRSIKEDAEYFLGEQIDDVVISVPAFFNNLQRKAVMQAGALAGFQVKRIINEPTAAAIAYGLQNMQAEDESKKQIVIVLDLGGGTFDISVMEIEGSVMEVVAICGDNRLGGGDFTQKLIDDFLNKNPICRELSTEEKSILWEEAQQAKHQISAEGKGDMRCVIDGREYEYSITEIEYEELCCDLLEKIRKLTLRAVKESKYEPYEISGIIMVGGGTKLSIVKKMVEKMIGKEIAYKIHPDEAVAMGAALQGGMILKEEGVKDLVMTDICPHYIGVPIWKGGKYDVVDYFDVIIPKNTTIPVRKKVKHNSYPGIWVFEILQSENPYGIDAVALDTFCYIIPDIGDSKVEVEKHITYDVNGIMYAEAYVPANGMRYSKIVKGDGCELTMEEAEKRLEELQYMNLGPRERDEDVLMMARAERLYVEASGSDREYLNSVMEGFESALTTGKVNRIALARERLVAALDRFERMGELS